MKLDRDRLLPVMIGAIPVVLVLSLLAFVALAGFGTLGAPNSAQTGGRNVPVPGSGYQPAPSSGQPGSTGSNGGSAFCLPLVGCV